MSTNIFATKARQNILDECGIKYKVDMELNFVFNTKADYEKAVNILENALELDEHER